VADCRDVPGTQCMYMYQCVVMLTAIPSLVTLVLENTSVTDAGVKLYASSVPPLLENLDLSRTNVTQHIFLPLQGITSCRPAYPSKQAFYTTQYSARKLILVLLMSCAKKVYVHRQSPTNTRQVPVGSVGKGPYPSGA